MKHRKKQKVASEQSPKSSDGMNARISIQVAGTAVTFDEKPKDAFHLMLIEQMGRIHELTIRHADHLRQAENGVEIDLFERTLNKLARTFASQIDVYHRCYRSTGEQRLTVQQNVSVNSGGQAIVANVGAKADAGAEPPIEPAVITHDRTEPMEVIETVAQSVPIVGGSDDEQS